MSKRVIVALILIPIGVGFIAVGGVPYGLFVALALGTAAWEYVRLFWQAGDQPSGWLVIGGVVVLVLTRVFLQFRWSDVALSLLVLIAMAVHLVRYEQGRDHAATDFALSLAGILYLGWIGAYLVSLRKLPEGLWWVLTILPIMWIVDAASMFIGEWLGRTKMVPRLSPRKTWEGYVGGVVGGILGGALLGWIWSFFSPALSAGIGALLGLILAVLAPLGDLGESMIKRQVRVKDSSQILPGHGGVFDRMDTWLWASVIGYYLVLLVS